MERLSPDEIREIAAAQASSEVLVRQGSPEPERLHEKAKELKEAQRKVHSSFAGCFARNRDRVKAVGENLDILDWEDENGATLRMIQRRSANSIKFALTEKSPTGDKISGVYARVPEAPRIDDDRRVFSVAGTFRGKDLASAEDYREVQEFLDGFSKVSTYVDPKAS